MNIFPRKKKVREPFCLEPVESKESFDFLAAVSKALLLFMLVYGSIGGFLSAYKIEYAHGVCMAAILLLACFLSIVYETGKRWLENLVCIGTFAAYFWLARQSYWMINSGCYAIVNQVNRVARQYLGVVNGTEYDLVVSDEYTAVTVFVLFLAMVGVMLFNILMQNRCHLLPLLVMTFSPFFVPMYFDRMPSLVYVLLLLAAYFTVWITNGFRMDNRVSAGFRFVLPVVTLVLGVFLYMLSFLVPETGYAKLLSDSRWKQQTRGQVANLAQYGLSALFQKRENGAGISGGKLSRGDSVMPSYQTDLVVRYTPYSYQGVYLKAYTGKDYTGDEWTAADDSWLDDAQLREAVDVRKEVFEKDSSGQGKGKMELQVVGASQEYWYEPYYTDGEKIAVKNNRIVYTYYPEKGKNGIVYDADASKDKVDPDYLKVPDRCKEAVETICEEAGLYGSESEIAVQITDFFAKNYKYTLRPGRYGSKEDYISYFLLKNKKGYCAHFASAATMLFRNQGIPARYVEGYAFSYLNVLLNGELVQDASYDDYYEGYSQLGRTGLVELKIPDAYAHAWVEIYVDGQGWMVVDPTPAASDEEDATSFWDAFRGIDGNTANTNFRFGTGVFAEYISFLFQRIGYLLLGLLVGLAVWLGIVRSRQRRQERRLDGQQRIQLFYRRLSRRLSEKYPEYARKRTLREQLSWIRQQEKVSFSEKIEERMYEAFFAREIAYDGEEILEELKKAERAIFGIK